MKCDKCGEVLDGAGLEYAAPPVVHTPERCLDRLAARLAEAEREREREHNVAAALASSHTALRAELAECRAELERALRTLLEPGLSPGFRIREATSIVSKVLAETEKEKP